MPTIEDWQIGQQALTVLVSVHRDERRNAQAYLDEIAAGHPRLTTAQLGTLVTADAQRYQQLLNRLRNYFSDPTLKAKLLDGITAYGFVQTDLSTEWNLLMNAATTQAAADVSSDAAIQAAANATLTAVPAIDLVY